MQILTYGKNLTEQECFFLFMVFVRSYEKRQVTKYTTRKRRGRGRSGKDFLMTIEETYQPRIEKIRLKKPYAVNKQYGFI
jgi:hypothetical protein